ncbi:DUF4252 domain-containing protein [Cognatitamlana onchidii]|uniref:DUF4252 domain-containing protein n=1 Tax=Cognatitamlana onchidii TaxID=2562860 RepID=UPI0010A6B354|nr:DUF4252 domain-containing protein [Algibacter onchidii]
MKRILYVFILFLTVVSCGPSFNSFYNNHKSDLGTTSFQVPRIVKTLIGTVSPEIDKAIGNISDFKYIKFEETNESKRADLIEEMNRVTNRRYTDVFRKHTLEHTQIISIIEKGTVVSDILIFKSDKEVTSALYLKGDFNGNKIRSLSQEGDMENLGDALLKSYNSNLN